MLANNVLCYGREEALPEVRPLRAGPLEMEFVEGDLRSIRCGRREILRRIYVAVRDANWGTISGVLSALRVESSDSDFRIRYVSDHRQGDIHFRWRAEITGSSEGTVLYVLDGTCLTTFRKNRIGICVHYPLEGCAGAPCQVEKAGGAVESGVFPLLVSPHQPFVDLRAIRHEVLPGLAAEVRFDGDIFEMEDHRNWTDAGFKTYSTPLRLPYPVTVEAGTRIRQSVKLTLRGNARPPHAARPKAVTVTVGSKEAPLPALGFVMASHGRPLTAREGALLRQLRPAHLRTEASTLETAVRDADLLGVPLEIAVTLGDRPSAELETLAAEVRRRRARIARWLIFAAKEKATPARLVGLARQYLPAAPFIGGTDAYFAELNRNRPDINAVDGACFSINPQVHAFDNLSLAENCAAQGEAVRSARQFLGGLPVHVTPVTLKPRGNPDATGAAATLAEGELPPQVDVRQMALFGAAWTLASLKYLAEAGPASITYYETTGWRGVMETAAGSPLPGKFRSLAGGVFPLWHVLAAVSGFRDAQVLVSRSDQPLLVESLVLRAGGRTRVLLANFTQSARDVRLAGMPAGGSLVALDAANVESAMREPEAFLAERGAPSGPELSLPPFAIAWLDFGK